MSDKKQDQPQEQDALVSVDDLGSDSIDLMSLSSEDDHLLMDTDDTPKNDIPSLGDGEIIPAKNDSQDIESPQEVSSQPLVAKDENKETLSEAAPEQIKKTSFLEGLGFGKKPRKAIISDETIIKPNAEAKRTMRVAQNTPRHNNEELTPYMPADIIGGSVPYIPGTEDEAVWNAAAQACGTNNVYYVYAVEDMRCWFLSVSAENLASVPNTWCPLAAALPGMSEHIDRETVYLYENEGIAAALRWDEDTGKMQVFSGPSRTLLPRIQSMDASFVTLSTENAEIVPWQHRALAQEKLARTTAKWLILSGLFVAMMAFLMWFAANTWAATLKPDLARAKSETSSAAMSLMMAASQALQNDVTRHMTRLQELLSQMNDIGGTLVKYELKNGQVAWEALVPPAVAATNLQKLSATTIGREDDGRLRIRGAR